jgi:hypothetical protein
MVMWLDHAVISYRDDFFSHVVEANDFWGLAFVKVAFDGITDFVVQFGHTVRFRKN